MESYKFFRIRLICLKIRQQLGTDSRIKSYIMAWCAFALGVRILISTLTTENDIRGIHFKQKSLIIFLSERHYFLSYCFTDYWKTKYFINTNNKANDKIKSEI